jgi:hypothetical protein
MSLDRCIPDMLANGEITQEQADRMRGLFDELEADLSTRFGQETARAKASEEAIGRLRAEAIQKKRQAVLQVAAQQRILHDLGRFDGKRGDAAIALFDHDERAPYSNVEARRRTIEGQAHAQMADILHRFHRDMLGRVRHRAELHNVIREAFGEDTGDLAAKQLAQAWMQTAEGLRTRFNAAGGGIGKLERWGMPQTHDMLAVRAVGFDEWRNYIAPLLDRERMLDSVTGMKMTPQGLEMALRGVYETVRSDGWAKRKPGGNAGAGKLANRHADSRFLVFKDADSWLSYNRRFGRPQSSIAEAIDPDGPIFDAMMGHISGMSRDIALTEILGPNPAATVRWIKDTLQHEEAVSSETSTRGLDKAVTASKQVQRLYDEIMGTNSQPENRRLAMYFSAMRSFQTAAKLGSATLSAVTDIGFQHVTRRFNGIPAAGVLADYAKLLNPASSGDRQLAMRLGLIAEEAGKRAVAQSRYINEVLTGEVSSRLAEGVLRASGLSAWTQAGRWAFGMAFLSHVTNEANRSWDNINPGFRRALSRYGFGAAEWDSLRATPIEEHRGSHWIMPENIADRHLADKLMEMVLTETDFAVPVASLRTRAMFNRFPKGTLIGELGRSALLFKSFGVSMLLTHGRRMMQSQLPNALKYAAGLTISTTLLGALAMQMKSVARGEDPQPMADPTFWGQAMAQGGGFGIFGDFINSATSRFDDDIYATLAGPIASDIVQLKRGGLDTVKSLKGEGGHPGRQLVRMIKSDLPGSSLWYTKLAFQRAILDQLQMQIDPDYYDSFDRMEQRAQQQGQDYWWRPGEIAPERSPTASNVLEGAPDR